MGDDLPPLFDAIADAIAHAIVTSIDHIDEAECVGFVVHIRSAGRTLTISLDPPEDESQSDG